MGKQALKLTFHLLQICFLTTISVAEATDRRDLLQPLTERLNFSALVEVEANYLSDFEDRKTSDIRLATVELEIDAEISSWANVHVLLLYEEDDTSPPELDEGVITLGRTEDIPVFFAAGKMYLPFGSFDTNMISDPLTLELGETNQSVALLGFEQDRFSASIYGFNCDIEEPGEEDRIQCFGSQLGYGLENEGYSLAITASFISNLADSDGFQAFIEDSGLELRNHEGAYGASISMTTGSVSILAEIVQASSDLKFTDGSRIESPQAFNIEASMGFDLFNKQSILAFAYQGSDHLAGFLPKTRVLSTIAMGLHEHLTAALEYSHDEDYNSSESGTGGKAHAFTAQLALDF